MASSLCFRNNENITILTEIPDINEPKVSPVFSVREYDWIIRFIAARNGSSKWNRFDAILDFVSDRNRFKPFQLWFDVTFRNERRTNFVQDKDKYVKIYSASYCFWNIDEDELLDVLPYPEESIYHPENNLKFSLKFYFPSEPVLNYNSKLKDGCSQTLSYVSLEYLSKNFADMFDKGLYTDVELKCGEHTFKVHKNVLCSRSQVFKAMFQGNMLESKTGLVEIQDIDFDSFKDFIRYLYAGKVPELTYNKAKILYEAGDKYAVKSLMMVCSEYLQENLTPENACDCLSLAESHSDQKLKDEIITYILTKKIYLDDEIWLPFCEKNPKLSDEVSRLLHIFSMWQQ